MELKIMKASLLALAVVLAAMMASPAFAKPSHPECNPNHVGSISPGHKKHGEKFCEGDTTPPALETTILSSPDSPMNDNEAIFTFESNRPGSRFECRFRGPAHPPWNPDFPDQGFQDCQSPWTISFLNIDPQGSHYFEVRAVDSDGNVDSTPAQAQFIRDTEAPTSYIERTTQSGSPFGGGTINFNDVNFQGYNVSHREYDSERFFCRLIGPGQSEEYVDCTTSGNRFFVQYNDLQNGSYQFAVYGVDAAGNVQASNTQDSFIVNVP
jgi:hypothetical protein